MSQIDAFLLAVVGTGVVFLLGWYVVYKIML